MSIFDILGPVMVGPSSSHTAGAVRIGLISRKLLEDEVQFADIQLFGSFAATGQGHGTDCAIVAGLLGMQPDDMRIPDSFSIAEEQGMKFFFSTGEGEDFHPNTAILTLQGKNGKRLVIQASSIGGGRIMVNKIDGIEVNFNAEMPTLVVHNYDVPGHVACVTGLLYREHINIATMQLYRNEKGGYAVLVVECDSPVPESVLKEIENSEGVLKVTYVDAGEGDAENV